ncbi:MAG: hypothetical protein VST69_04625, partial [Nitrospirota bacterium]|nr:hypothetical protein [Nitrospirota bacterium]
QLYAAAERSGNSHNLSEELISCMKGFTNNFRLFLHYASFPVVFLLGYLKPDIFNPLADSILWFEKKIILVDLLSEFHKIIPALIWIVIIVGLVLLLRFVCSYRYNLQKIINKPVRKE